MKRVGFLLGKDLRVLLRSPAVVAALLLYPLLVAVIVGLVVRYAGERPRLALVDQDGLPSVLVVGEREFDVQALFDEAAEDVELVPMAADEAERELETGEVLGVLVVPSGFSRDLRSLVESPNLVLRTTPGGLATRTVEKAEALVFGLNQELQQAYIETNIAYLELLLEGGSGTVLGNEFTLIGLADAELRLEELTQSGDPATREQAEVLLSFMRQTTTAVGGVDEFLRATANPIHLVEERGGGRQWLLSAQVQAWAFALALGFVGLLLGSAGIAAERDENVIGRLLSGLVRLRELVVEKTLLVMVVGGALGLLLALAFGITVELGGVAGGEPWERLPIIVLGLLLTGASFGSLGVLIGALARETRTATLVAFLAALPIILLGLVPTGSVPAAGWISEAFPFAHAAELFVSGLSDADPALTVLREAGALIGLCAAYAAAAALVVRRLLA